MKQRAEHTQKIINYIQKHPTKSVDDLVQKFNISKPYAYKLRSAAAQEDNAWSAVHDPESNTIVATHSGPTKVDIILDQRATQYGKFIEGAEVMQTLKQVVRSSLQKRGTALAFDQLEAIDMIIHKLGRVINGNPDNVDSWRDIAGYATLVADRLEGNVR